MQVKDFHFELPEELIASFPLEQRSARAVCYLLMASLVNSTHDHPLPMCLDLIQPGDLDGVQRHPCYPSAFVWY